MRVTLDCLTPDLDEQVSRMKDDGLDFMGVAHVGKTTRDLGRHFADSFDSSLIYLPSLDRRNAVSKPVICFMNNLYKFLPVPILRILSESYKKIYCGSERFLPENIPADLPGAFNLGHLLIVDDNSLTGATFETWKEEIGRVSSSSITTFSITATGDYRPDYFCYDSWRSFSWRPIGI